MIVRGGKPRYSASDLTNFLECEHLAWLERERAFGRIDAPADPPDPLADLLGRKGNAHEQAYLAKLAAKGTRVAHIERDPKAPDPTAAALAQTIEAMRSGAPVIYQASLERDGWFGIADFLERVQRPSELGAWSYEVADTKLARRTKPYYLIQLSLYSDLVQGIQGIAPQHMHVLLDGGARDTQLCADYGAYFRTLRAQYEQFVAQNGDATTYPLPVEHCDVCRWGSACKDRWERDDHLCGVADIRKKQIRRLEAEGVRTMAALAALPDGQRVPKMASTTLATLHAQAALQVGQRASGHLGYELLPPLAGRGFALLPEPDPADVFFDMEGDPFAGPHGREYLFGADALDERGEPGYRAWWGHDGHGERHAFEAFIDFVTERRRKAPRLHVYHYAHYEPTALKRLAGFYATREAELDNLLRGQVFVDLYRVVRQSMRASLPSYSIKDIEALYMGARAAEIQSGGDSIVEYELWLESHDDQRLDAIAHYNAEDCRSTRLLRDWLLERKGESHARFGPPPAPPPPPEEKPRTDEQLAVEAERADLIARLIAGLDPDPETLTGQDRARWLLAQVVDYHQREARPAWWMFYARLEMSDDELFDDSEAIAGLEPIPGVSAVPEKKSLVHTLRFPPQEFKLGTGLVVDPSTAKSAGEVLAVDGRAGTLRLKRGPSLVGVDLPRALAPNGPIDNKEQRRAIRRVARSVLEHGFGDASPYRALTDLLLGEFPRIAGRERGAQLQDGVMDFDRAWPVVRGLDRSSIVIQGPPGSGKTYLGARLIVVLLEEGKTLGVTALSHRAIHNLLHEVEEVARERGFAFRGLKKCSGDGGAEDDTAFRSKLTTPFIANTSENPQGMPPGVTLLAGTAWLFPRADLDRSLDYLFVDEAGQVSLADAIAVGTAARNLVLLGDPQQLPQVSQGTHPSGAGASVLEHVLQGHDTIPPNRGLFLDRTWRMHPDVCRFISELSYEGRLVSAPGRERQRVDAPDAPGLGGTGLRYVPVEHEGNAQKSGKEAAVVADFCGRLLRGTFTEQEGRRRPMTVNDILVVTPYNAQVRTLLEVLPAGAQVGTVDKFQGREAPVVVFSMATSSEEDMPRGVDFLFSRNRLNVAISRAKALSVLVASPRLLQIRCRSAEQMKLVNGLCEFVEFAEAIR